MGWLGCSIGGARAAQGGAGWCRALRPPLGRYQHPKSPSPPPHNWGYTPARPPAPPHAQTKHFCNPVLISQLTDIHYISIISQNITDNVLLRTPLTGPERFDELGMATAAMKLKARGGAKRAMSRAE